MYIVYSIYINIFDTTTHNIIIVACTYSIIIYVPQLRWIFETAHIPTFADDADNNPLVAGNMPISHVLGTSSQQLPAIPFCFQSWQWQAYRCYQQCQRHSATAIKLHGDFSFCSSWCQWKPDETSVIFACFCHQKYMRSKVFLEASPGWWFQLFMTVCKNMQTRYIVLPS